MTGIGRDDLLSTAIGGGFLLGAATACRETDPGRFAQIVGAVLRSCRDLAEVDPVMARVLHEKAEAVLHGRAEDAIPQVRELAPSRGVIWTCGVCGVIRETAIPAGGSVAERVAAEHGDASPECEGSLESGTILGRVVRAGEPDHRAIER